MVECSLPEKYCCCRLKIGLAICGFIIVTLGFITIMAFAYYAAIMDRNTYKYAFVFAIVGCILWISIVVFALIGLIGGVIMEKPKKMFLYYEVLCAHLAAIIIQFVFMGIDNPLTIPISLLVIAILIYNLLCMKSRLQDLEENN